MSSRYRTYILIVLMITNAVNFIDRQVISILAPSIKSDLALSSVC